MHVYYTFVNRQNAIRNIIYRLNEQKLIKIRTYGIVLHITDCAIISGDSANAIYKEMQLLRGRRFL